MLATISPLASAAAESQNTLAFADRASRVMQRVRANEVVDDAELLRAARAEIARLRALLEDGAGADSRVATLQQQLGEERAAVRHWRGEAADLRQQVRRLLAASCKRCQRKRRRAGGGHKPELREPLRAGGWAGGARALPS